MIFWWLLLIVLIVVAVRWAVRSKPEKGSQSPQSALEVLKKRYAKGEISEEEFESKKKKLMK